ncbi:hypothetical protein [Streptomyces sp. N50]|nr:hypothetical protein [Streptomyces sp. N50]WOX16421.1 hypothetical protein R2B38_47290 [Streptomyces sp. N50]
MMRDLFADLYDRPAGPAPTSAVSVWALTTPWPYIRAVASVRLGPVPEPA